MCIRDRPWLELAIFLVCYLDLLYLVLPGWVESSPISGQAPFRASSCLQSMVCIAWDHQLQADQVARCWETWSLTIYVTGSFVLWVCAYVEFDQFKPFLKELKLKLGVFMTKGQSCCPGPGLAEAGCASRGGASSRLEHWPSSILDMFNFNFAFSNVLF